ncbi:MAG: S-adenosyl-l-methionine hydroxide adenosyltransferase family protein [Chitinophagaceae bacterium]
MMKLFTFLLGILITGCTNKKAVVFQSDFGLKDGAVSAMKGVAHQVNGDLSLFDITHDITAYDTWEAAYRLYQVAGYWPKGTVFVSVVDPGVGTGRRSIVMKSTSGHYFVTPDNGSLTLVAESLGIEAVRQINESVNRRRYSDSSYTFHGRDLYSYTAARLASGLISFEELGNLLSDSIVKLPYQKPILENDLIKGNIPVLDIQFGNVWTNIPDSLFKKLTISYGQRVNIKVKQEDSVVYQGDLPYVRTFGDVQEGAGLVYVNSLMNISLAVNMGSFSNHFKVKSGKDWTILIKRGD